MMIDLNVSAFFGEGSEYSIRAANPRRLVVAFQLPRSGPLLEQRVVLTATEIWGIRTQDDL